MAGEVDSEEDAHRKTASFVERRLNGKDQWADVWKYPSFDNVKIRTPGTTAGEELLELSVRRS